MIFFFEKPGNATVHTKSNATVHVESNATVHMKSNATVCLSGLPLYWLTLCSFRLEECLRVAHFD
jgi:hypothetical protein